MGRHRRRRDEPNWCTWHAHRFVEVTDPKHGSRIVCRRCGTVWEPQERFTVTLPAVSAADPWQSVSQSG